LTGVLIAIVVVRFPLISGNLIDRLTLRTPNLAADQLFLHLQSRAAFRAFEFDGHAAPPGEIQTIINSRILSEKAHRNSIESPDHSRGNISTTDSNHGTQPWPALSKKGEPAPPGFSLRSDLILTPIVPAPPVMRRIPVTPIVLYLPELDGRHYSRQGIEIRIRRVNRVWPQTQAGPTDRMNANLFVRAWFDSWLHSISVSAMENLQIPAGKRSNLQKTK
jgi:hypothetical protein